MNLCVVGVIFTGCSRVFCCRLIAHRLSVMRPRWSAQVRLKTNGKSVEMKKGNNYGEDLTCGSEDSIACTRYWNRSYDCGCTLIHIDSLLRTAYKPELFLCSSGLVGLV